MKKTFYNLFIGTGTAVALCLLGGIARTADADRSHHRELAITEVHVVHEDPDNDSADTIRITVDGVDLDRARHITVLLGTEIELVVLSATGNEIVALCQGLAMICDNGDFRLTVVVESYRKHGKRKRVRVATYDLTIGATGPRGEQGDPGPQGEPGVSGYQRISCGPFFTGSGVGREAFTCQCPAGKVAVAGGIADLRFPITVPNSRDFNIAALHPHDDSRWRARWFNGTGASANVTLYTVCVTAN